MFPSNFDRLGSSQFNNININLNFGGASNVGGAKDILTELLNMFSPNADNSNDIFGGFLNGNTSTAAANDPAPVETPAIVDGDQPSGSLKVDGNTITTAGGYKIEQTGQYNWKITGPDGKETSVTGDPHVRSNGGDNFDFHKDSTFVLGDGTKINVSTVPYSGNNGNTVTGKLEIISGNDRVEVNDIDKGLGKIGTVTQDGYAHANSFQGQVFVEGQQTDKWSLNGKEIMGNDSGDDNFKLGDDLAAGTATPTTNTGNPRNINQMFTNFLDNRIAMLTSLRNLFSGNSIPQNQLGSNPYTGNSTPPWQSGQSYNRNQHRAVLSHAFRQMSQMFGVLARFSQMSTDFSSMRQRAQLFTPDLNATPDLNG